MVAGPGCLDLCEFMGATQHREAQRWSSRSRFFNAANSTPDRAWRVKIVSSTGKFDATGRRICRFGDLRL
jgi:hypothetical protein